MIAPELSEFFDRIRPFLLGETSAEDVALSCGPSPSGVERLALYRVEVSASHAGIMERQYPLCKWHVSPEAWRQMLSEFLRVHVPSGWDAHQVGVAFPAWLAERISDGAIIPAYLPALAEFELLDHDTYRHEAPDHPPAEAGGPSALNPTLDIRSLRFDIPSWIAGGCPPEGPLPRPTIVIAYRDPRTLEARFVDGTPIVMFVIQALHQGLDPVDAAMAHGLDAAAVRGLVRDLADRGLLVAPQN